MTVVLSRVCLRALGTTPPSEFLIFHAGLNSTEKGDFLFDEEAAASVLAAYRRQGVDLILDLEHLSLDDAAPHYDPDARAHYQLELRGGDLWATNVKWGPDGLRRLTQKTQRYTSPAFRADPETRRILELVNVGLVAMPATHGNAPLVAANKGACAPAAVKHTRGRTPQKVTRLNRMNAELVKKLLDAIEAGDLEALKGIAKELVAAAAAGGEPADPGAEAMSDTAETPPEDSPDMKELAALRAEVARLSKVTSQTQNAELIKLRAEVDRLKGLADATESAERLELCGELVKLGVEFPVTAWEGEPEKRVPVKRLRDEPIDGLRARVEQLRKLAPARGNAVAPPSAAPEREFRTSHGVVTLSAGEVKACEEAGAKLEDYAENKAIRTAARKGSK